MATIHPSMIIRMNIDSREYSETLREEIRRSYAYVSTAVVNPVDVESDEIQNTMQLDVKLHKPYWDENDAAQQETWNAGMEKWLHNMFVKLSGTVQGANATYQEHGKNPLFYAWTEVKFGNDALITFKTPQDCGLGDAHVARIADVRHLLCAGAFGSNVARVRIPSLASYQEQARKLVEADKAKAAAQEHVQRLAQAEQEIPADMAAAAKANVPGEVVVLQSDAAMLRKSEWAKRHDNVDTADNAEPSAQEETAENPMPETPGTPDAVSAEQHSDTAAEPITQTYVNFDPDTRIWGIEYANGNVRQYDSEQQAFID